MFLTQSQLAQAEAAVLPVQVLFLALLPPREAAEGHLLGLPGGLVDRAAAAPVVYLLPVVLETVADIPLLKDQMAVRAALRVAAALQTMAAAAAVVADQAMVLLQRVVLARVAAAAYQALFLAPLFLTLAVAGAVADHLAPEGPAAAVVLETEALEQQLEPELAQLPTRGLAAVAARQEAALVMPEAVVGLA